MSRSLSLFAGLALLLAASVPARASDSAASEASHAAGGAVIAGAVTYLADDHWPKYRGWIGFSAGTLAGIVGEAVDSANGNGFSGLDVAATALGAAIGAVTFSGSVIAFLKLNGNMSGAPILLPARHVINLAIGLGIIGSTIAFAASSAAATSGWGSERGGGAVRRG